MLFLAQKGQDSTALVVIWEPMGDETAPPGLRPAVRAAIGPHPTIVCANARGKETFNQIGAFAQRETGIRLFWLASLMGFSLGCMRVRDAILEQGARPYSVVLIDGLHGDLPPLNWQVRYAQALAREARKGKMITVIAHTYIEPSTFTSSHRMAEIATGWDLPAPALGETKIRREAPAPDARNWRGHLAVYSTGSGANDKAAHVREATEIMPQAITAEVRELLDLAHQPSDNDGPPAGQATPEDVDIPLGDRALLVAQAEIDAGITEDPMGSNRGPRVDAYEAPAGQKGASWCALGFSFCGSKALGPGEVLPHAYVGRVAALIASAGEFWHPIGDGYVPKRGDGAVYERNNQSPARGGDGHIARVADPPDAAGDYVTAGADEENGWRVKSRNTADEGSSRKLAGWIEYPARGRAPTKAARPSAPTKTARVPGKVFVQGGWVGIEADYLPRVVTAEDGAAPPAALRAQAIAARTYLLRQLRDDSALGTPGKPVPVGQSFQAVAPTSSDAAREAVVATRGQVVTWGGRLTLGNYVAGAGPWLGRDNKPPAPDPTHTEKLVTYNEGKRGDQVTKTMQVSQRPDNRGCMSQNGANWLAAHGASEMEILRYFYGADVEIGTVPTSAPKSTQPPPATLRPAPSSGGDGGGLAVIGLFGLVARATGLFGGKGSA